MPFSSLSDPTALERAQAVLDAAWSQIADTIPEKDRERERIHLAYAVVSALREATDEADVVLIALENFHSKKP